MRQKEKQHSKNIMLFLNRDILVFVNLFGLHLTSYSSILKMSSVNLVTVKD
jgi:hypothetical protein